MISYLAESLNFADEMCLNIIDVKGGTMPMSMTGDEEVNSDTVAENHNTEGFDTASPVSVSCELG